MPRRSLRYMMAVSTSVVSSVCLFGCAPTAGSSGAQTPPSSVSAGATPAPGVLSLAGAVDKPAELALDRLRAMPAQTATVTFGTSKGSETHVETGVPLIALLRSAGLTVDPARKNDSANFAVLAVGADGYSAVVSYGELDPNAGNRQVLVALTQDKIPLPRPRLVVVGDVKGGRAVNDLVKLQVVRLSTD